MAMTWAWTAMVCAALLWAVFTGEARAVGEAAMAGAGEALELCVAMAGPVVLWSGLMEVMEASGLSRALARGLGPVLGRLYPSSAGDAALAEDLACNMSSNLLGLGNAATPAGVRAAIRLHRRDVGGAAGNELCRLVVLNTASIQLLPTTVAALRSALGCQSPLDILPAVWLSSAVSVCVGLAAARLFSRLT